MARSHIPSKPIEPIELTLGEIPNSKIWYKNIIEQILSDKGSMVDGFMSILTELGVGVAPTELGVGVAVAPTELNAPLDMSFETPSGVAPTELGVAVAVAPTELNAPLDMSFETPSGMDISLNEDISLRQTFAQLESVIAHDPAHAHPPAPFSQMEIENLMKLSQTKAEMQEEFE